MGRHCSYVSLGEFQYFLAYLKAAPVPASAAPLAGTLSLSVPFPLVKWYETNQWADYSHVGTTESEIRLETPFVTTEIFMETVHKCHDFLRSVSDHQLLRRNSAKSRIRSNASITESFFFPRSCRDNIPERGRVERSPCLPPGSSCPCLPQLGLCLPCRRKSTSPERDDQTDPPSWH